MSPLTGLFRISSETRGDSSDGRCTRQLQALPRTPETRQFPPSFVWGAATSSYQIEGAVDRRRARREHLGPLLRDAGQDRRRFERCGGMRPLPPLARRRRDDAPDRSRRLPLLDRLAACPADGSRDGERSWPRLLRPPRRRPPRGGNRADADAVPLGPSPGARGPGRLAGAGDRRGLRRVRPGRRRTARRPGLDVDDVE